MEKIKDKYRTASDEFVNQMKLDKDHVFCKMHQLRRDKDKLLYQQINTLHEDYLKSVK